MALNFIERANPINIGIININLFLFPFIIQLYIWLHINKDIENKKSSTPK